MLVLSRKQQQEIVIGDNIRITVVKIKGNTVRLGELPPKIEPRTTRVESGEEQVANVTVVFTDPIERDSGSGNSRNSEVEVLKFEKSSAEGCSISFRQTTPEVLKHNRLKQIVEDISKSSSKS